MLWKMNKIIEKGLFIIKVGNFFYPIDTWSIRYCSHVTSNVYTTTADINKKLEFIRKSGFKMNRVRMITQIEELDKKRYKIYIDQEFAFVLYKGEVAKYGLKVNDFMEDKLYSAVKKEILPQRAKKRCLNLLQQRPYTEQKLREKLSEGYYTDDMIEEAIAYVKSFHYVDDYEYACQYIFYHKEVETRKKIEEKLFIKGIDHYTLQKAFENFYSSEEEVLEMEMQQAKKLLQKKHYDAQNADWKERQKVYAFLLRKGICAHVVKKAMEL